MPHVAALRREVDNTPAVRAGGGLQADSFRPPSRVRPSPTCATRLTVAVGSFQKNRRQKRTEIAAQTVSMEAAPLSPSFPSGTGRQQIADEVKLLNAARRSFSENFERCTNTG